MIKHHSLTGHTAYIDLLDFHKDEKISEIQGSITRKERNGKVHLYDSYRIGKKVVKRYIGVESPELLGKIAKMSKLRSELENRRQQQARLVRRLRGESYKMFDKSLGSILSAFARAGVFRLGGTLVGTTAFRCYEYELGAKIESDDLSMTNDIDIASFTRLSLAIEDKVEPSMQETFKKLSFGEVLSLDRNKSYRWKQAENNFQVEFLTPSFDQEEKIQRLATLGVYAQSLHFLNYLIAEPIPAVALYRNGVLIQIPQPERFAIHKLIISDRRRDGTNSTKSKKDLWQAEWLLEVLAEDRPGQLYLAYKDALGRGKKWKKHIKCSLDRSPKSKANIKKAKKYFKSG